jgi:hypothetical protein
MKRQNKDYRELETQNIQKEKEMKQSQVEMLRREEERSARRFEIPEEPQSGDIIRINFRDPAGNTQTRNFDSSQPLSLVYKWVETNDGIKFEDNSKRQFELMHGYPPSSIHSLRDKKLREIFDSDQEKVIIKEL